MMQSILETTENTRDLGGYSGKSGITRNWMFLRSDAPKQLTEGDTALLLSHNITTIIDLREPGKVNLAENPFVSRKQFDWHHCPISEGSSIPQSVEAVPESYLAISESNGMAEAFHCIAAAPAGVLFHCTAGKDRTGVLSCILLQLAEVPEELVLLDYALTGEYLVNRLRSIREKFPELDPDIYHPHPSHLAAFLERWKEKYGNAENYLQSIGLSSDEIRMIRFKLIQS